MIISDGDFKLTLEQINRLYTIVGNLRERHMPHEPEHYWFQAEAPLEMILEMQRDINKYLSKPKVSKMPKKGKRLKKAS